jgi:hypothetical protein
MSAKKAKKRAEMKRVAPKWGVLPEGFLKYRVKYREHQAWESMCREVQAYQEQ